MPPKYEPLEHLLLGSAQQRVTISFLDLDALVRGLPPSARANRTWWGNTTATHRTQAHAWMRAGYRVRELRLGDSVTFDYEGPLTAEAARTRSRVTSRRPSVLDGVEQLTLVLQRAGYGSVAAAVAEHAVFLHPDTVVQAAGSPLFPTVRDLLRRGHVDTLPSGRRVMLDDNTSPTHAFLWAAQLAKGLDVQFNHLWGDSRNPDTYSALWNLCATPAFLSRTTDGRNHPGVIAALRYRSFELYGGQTSRDQEPLPPDGYAELTWAPHPPPVRDLEATLRARLRESAKSRTAVACRDLGWLFSGWRPDASL